MVKNPFYSVLKCKLTALFSPIQCTISQFFDQRMMAKNHFDILMRSCTYIYISYNFRFQNNEKNSKKKKLKEYPLHSIIIVINLTTLLNLFKVIKFLVVKVIIIIIVSFIY